MRKLLGGAGAALGVKIASGFAVAALAATAAGAATEVAVTGSLNPADWGKQVTQQVQNCKDTLRASGTRGIGQCVSQFAKQHGKIVSAEHRASNARENNVSGSGKDKGKHKGQSELQPGNRPTTAPGLVHTGPTGVPES